MRPILQNSKCYPTFLDPGISREALGTSFSLSRRESRTAAEILTPNSLTRIRYCVISCQNIQGLTLSLPSLQVPNSGHQSESTAGALRQTTTPAFHRESPGDSAFCHPTVPYRVLLTVYPTILLPLLRTTTTTIVTRPDYQVEAVTGTTKLEDYKRDERIKC